MNPIDTNRIANALERIAHALEHLNIENIEHAHIDDIEHAHIDDVGELHGGESYYKQND
tara:strand:- start:375 stop:551 length:177 start_codon:yes stop_codon:yes gene_type:complete